jgi:hypothetical protein
MLRFWAAERQGHAFPAVNAGGGAERPHYFGSGHRMTLQSIENHLFVNHLNPAKGYVKKWGF